MTGSADAIRVVPDGAPSWTNWAGNQEVFPKQILRPKTLEELRQIVADTTARRGRMHAVATGLSFSDILQTDDTLVVLTELTSPDTPGALLPTEEELFTRPATAPLVRVICGARIRDINNALARAGLALPNLGGYDSQTLIGAISTSTHGSGITLGPLPSLVRSLDLVSTGGAMYRIEPTNGPTDVKRFADRYKTTRQLVKNDDWFYTAVVSMGCTGVIYSALIEVQAAYRLVERRSVKRWSQVKPEIRKKNQEHRHYEISIIPYRLRGTKDDHMCLVTERDIASLEEPTIPLPAGRRAAETLAFLPSTERTIVRTMSDQPRLVPTILEVAMEQLCTGNTAHVEASYRVFNLNKVNGARVLSGEYFFPLEGDKYLQAIDAIFDVVAKNQRYGICLTAPISLRFIRPAKAYLSMTEGCESSEGYCSVEISTYSEIEGAHEAILSYEQVCCSNACGGRAHWGQLHELTGARGWLDARYPKAKAWKEAHRKLNWRGTFNNHFTDRLDLSVEVS